MEAGRALCPHRALEPTIDVITTNLSSLWHFGGVFSSRMNGFTVQGRWRAACMALCGKDVCWRQLYGLRSPWWRWGYGMGNENKCILLMAFWMCTDTTMRSWDPFLCHLSHQAMTVRCHTIPGSWKHPSSCMVSTHRTCHSLSMLGMFWIGVHNSVFRFQSISSNFTQPLKRRGVQQEMCCNAWGRYWHPPPIQCNMEWPFIVGSPRHNCAIVMSSNQTYHIFSISRQWAGGIKGTHGNISLTD